MAMFQKSINKLERIEQADTIDGEVFSLKENYFP